MSIPTIIPILRIFDLDIAKTFYVDYLGFKIDWEHQFEENFPKYIQVSKENIVLHLSQHYGDAAPGSSIRVYYANLINFHKNLEEKDHTHIKPQIEVKPWELSEMMLMDPFYNRIIFWNE